MTKRILIATTSHTRKGDTGQPTGAYLPEIAHPHAVFRRAGYAVELASVRGGAVPLDGVEGADVASLTFLDEHRETLAHSLPAAAVDPARYDAIFFAGGHGAMWDLPDDAAFMRASAAIYERGGVVAAVCHGPAALVNVRLSNGAFLVAGRQVSAFTNAEERAVGLDRVVPFLLEDRLNARGAQHVPGPLWQANVVASDRLVTGQNPASATGVAEAVIETLQRLPGPAARRAEPYSMNDTPNEIVG
ncbi:MAG TPA: type 1 glutamine amidotransferase domain-containing protein [Polyangia bacterium]|nr:type 1 glutamine amidotransferase domain-containing protein [Polyangia bacterium]